MHAGVPPPPHGYPFPPYLSHEAIKAARNAPAAPVAPAPAAAAPAADAAEDSGSDTHCTWHHALVFDSREERGVRRDASSAAAAATSAATPGEWKYVSWRCRALRTRNRHVPFYLPAAMPALCTHLLVNPRGGQYRCVQAAKAHKCNLMGASVQD